MARDFVASRMMDGLAKPA